MKKILVNTLLVLATIVTVLWCTYLLVRNLSQTDFTSPATLFGSLTGGLLVFVGFGVLGYWLAGRKNRRRWPWTLACAALGPWPLIPLALLRRRAADVGPDGVLITLHHDGV
jgi:hypothetical protein